MHHFQNILFQKDHTDFIDKQHCFLTSEHRFFAWSQKLANNDAPDILAYGTHNEFLTPSVKENINRDYQFLLKADNKPIPNACVLLLITNEPYPKILLTRRSNRLSSHGGEVSLVGGKKDDGDTSSYQIALREANEEIALPLDAVELMGFLPMQFSKKGLLVRPVVACVSPDICSSLSGNRDEIDKIFWVALDFLQNNPPQNHIITYQTHKQSFVAHTPAWIIQDGKEKEIIWGLTGRILANFLSIITDNTQIHFNDNWYFKKG